MHLVAASSGSCSRAAGALFAIRYKAGWPQRVRSSFGRHQLGL